MEGLERIHEAFTASNNGSAEDRALGRRHVFQPLVDPGDYGHIPLLLPNSDEDREMLERLLPEHFRYADDALIRELTVLNERITKELARGDLAGRGATADLDAAIDQDKESMLQSVWTYAAIGLVVTCLSFGVSDAPLPVLLAFFSVLYLFVSLIKAYVSTVVTKLRTSIVSGKPIVVGWAALLTLLFGLLVFALVTTIMSQVTPLLREGGLAVYSFVEIAVIPATIICTTQPQNG